MVKVRMFGGLLCLSAIAFARADEIKVEKIEDAAQDGTGQIWALAQEARDEIYRSTDGVHWQSVRFDAPFHEARPISFGQGREGSILCTWYGEGGKYFLSEHQGLLSRVRATLNGPLRREHILVDSSGNIWLTEEGEKIFRISPSETMASLFTIRPEQFHIQDSPRDIDAYNPICVLEDARHRVWFWSNALVGASNASSLRGVMIFDGEKFEHHETLAGLPDKIFSVLENKDAQRLWLAVEDDALYQLDLATLRAERVPEPEPNALRFVQRIFRVDDDWFFITGAMWDRLSEEAGGGRIGTLWRLRAGNWTKMLAGIDDRTEYRNSGRRPWLQTSRGLLLGSFGNGAWLRPNAGSPVPIDWRSGFGLSDTQRLFRLNDGRILALALDRHGHRRGVAARGTRSAILPSGLAGLGEEPNERIQILRIRGNQRGEFTEENGWRLKSVERGSDDQVETTEITPPPGCVTSEPDSIVRDNQDCFWLTWRDQLYRARPGLSVPVFAPGEPQPFMDGRGVAEAFVDPRGKAFLRTIKEGRDEYIVLSGDEPQPETAVEWNKIAADAIRLKFFMTNATGRACFIWRLDAEEWSRLTSDPELLLEALVPGPHRIEVAAVDEKLQADPAPAEVAFEVRIDPAKQIAALLERLSDPDFAKRGWAIQALARRPSLALPALKAAREKASDDQRWWIDAARQECEERISKSTKP